MKKPCHECPFRKTSAEGYLGEAMHDPERFLQSIGHSPIPCHLKVDWEDRESVDEAAVTAWRLPCVGSLQFLNNSLKSPRGREYHELVQKHGKNQEVFKWAKDFIEHHNQ